MLAKQNNMAVLNWFLNNTIFALGDIQNVCVRMNLISYKYMYACYCPMW